MRTTLRQKFRWGLLEALHARLVLLLRALTPEQMPRRLRHPNMAR